MVRDPLYNQNWGRRQVGADLPLAGKPLFSYQMTISTTIDYPTKTIIMDQKTDSPGSNVYRYIVATKEKQIRKALIALGWTPPPRVRWWHGLFNKPVPTDDTPRQGSAGDDK